MKIGCKSLSFSQCLLRSCFTVAAFSIESKFILALTIVKSISSSYLDKNDIADFT